jgi:CheY-like chemotaxis protein
MTPKKTVLVIDDDTDFQASVRSLLEAEGYEVVPALTGREGLRKLRETKPHVVVLDIMMESPTEGYGVSESIKHGEEYADVRDTPVVMVSSIRETPDERFPRSPDVEMIRPDRYLTKPLDIPRFLEIVARVARR